MIFVLWFSFYASLKFEVKKSSQEDEYVNYLVWMKTMMETTRYVLACKLHKYLGLSLGN